MPPLGMRRAELRLLKDRDAQDNRQVPAVGAIATVYRQGATVSAAVEVHEHDTLTVPVYSPGRLQYGDDVVAIGGPDREFQVRALGETSLELDYLGTSDLILSPGERIYPTTPLQVFAGDAPHFLDSVDPQIVWSAPRLQARQIDQRSLIAEG